MTRGEHGRFEVSILIFTKHGNAVRVHQERCRSHRHLPITLTATPPKLPCPQDVLGLAQDLPRALIPEWWDKALRYRNDIAVIGRWRLPRNGRGIGGPWSHGAGVRGGCLSGLALYESLLAFTAKSRRQQKDCFELHLLLLRFLT